MDEYEKKFTVALHGVVDVLKHMNNLNGERESLGEKIVKSDNVRDLLSGRGNQARIPISDLEIRTAVISDHSQNQPLVNTLRPAIEPGARRKLFLRDLLRQGICSDAAVEFPTENTLTDNTGVQVAGSPQAFENVSFAESGVTFSLSFQPCISIGTWVKTSRQVLEDGDTLNAFLSGTLLYMLRLEEESQILNGTNANGQLNGLITAATAYSVQSPQLTNEIDILRGMIKQAQIADFNPDVIVVHPTDWYDISVRKAGASDDTYAAGNPHDMAAPSLWGLPVVVTNSIPVTKALVLDTSRAAILFDRQEAAVELGYHDDDNFRRGMVTLRAVERVSQVIVNSGGIILGTI